MFFSWYWDRFLVHEKLAQQGTCRRYPGLAVALSVALALALDWSTKLCLLPQHPRESRHGELKMLVTSHCPQE